jgi:hypothetical protein
MRFAVLPNRDAKDSGLQSAVLDTLASRPGSWRFDEIEQAVTGFDAMSVRKMVWYLSSLGRVEIERGALSLPWQITPGRGHCREGRGPATPGRVV